MLKYCLFAVFLATVGATNFYQIHNPRTSFGYVYNNGSVDAPIKIEMYMGLQCEDAAKAVPAVKAAADAYGAGVVQLKFHVFPLPYFTGDFLSCKGTRVVSNLAPEKVVDFMQTIMTNQYRIGRAPCTITDLELMELLTDFAVEMGVDRDRFYVQFSNPHTTNHCKQQWKAHIASGIYASPTFKLNGVHVVDWNPSWTKQDWSALIDYLLAPPVHGELTTPGIMW
ncbi:uncharacterized protein [Ptychodera flava]|uniref:uncharacterized protein n=1 Tax=Ptychodera flava TaxID=63121 RepID=UPI003969C289